jgi:hypothetical protein
MSEKDTYLSNFDDIILHAGLGLCQTRTNHFMLIAFHWLINSSWCKGYDIAMMTNE